MHSLLGPMLGIGPGQVVTHQPSGMHLAPPLTKRSVHTAAVATALAEVQRAPVSSIAPPPLRPASTRQQTQAPRVSRKKRPEQLSDRVSVMPGVGPKYTELLAAHNIRTVRDLVALHVHRHSRQMQLTQQFLKEEVGINNSSCLSRIATYVEQKQLELAKEESQAADEGQAGTSWLQPKVTLSVEGNISAGKSTFLKILEGKGLLRDKLQVVPEPVEQWQNVGVGSDKVNLLMEFYNAPQRMAYTFQNYVFLTRMMQERESYTASAMCRLLERSVFSDRMVFVRSVHSAKYMSDTELAIYNSWFDPVLSTLPTLVPNGFIYLRAQPQTCHKRLKRRARSEESSVKLDYLQDLHSKHEDWLIDGGDPLPASERSGQYIWVADKAGGYALQNASSIAQPPSGGLLRPGLRFEIHDRAPGSREVQQHLATAARLPPVPKALDRAIRFLDTSRGEHMHPMLHTIPALVLDCDQDVDVDRDEDYKAHVARMVDQYCEYVRQYIVARGLAVAEHERRAADAVRGVFAEAGQSVIVPNSLHGGGGALAGDGIHFPPSGAFNGYSVNVRGTTLYVDSKAPLVAFASQQARQAAAAGLL